MTDFETEKANKTMPPMEDLSDAHNAIFSRERNKEKFEALRIRDAHLLKAQKRPLDEKEKTFLNLLKEKKPFTFYDQLGFFDRKKEYFKGYISARDNIIYLEYSSKQYNFFECYEHLFVRTEELVIMEYIFIKFVKKDLFKIFIL